MYGPYNARMSNEIYSCRINDKKLEVDKNPNFLYDEYALYYDNKKLSGSKSKKVYKLLEQKKNIKK